MGFLLVAVPFLLFALVFLDFARDGWLANVIEAVMFPVIMGIVFAIGALFGMVYHFTGSLLLVIAAHTVYDIFALRFLFREFERLQLAEPTLLE